MHHRKILFLLINLIGGAAVLGSYAYGVTTNPAAGSDLWGGVPESLRPLYSVNMFLAAGGYLIAFAYFMLKLNPEDSLLNGAPIFERINWLYGVILFCSAIWLPLTTAMVAAPDAALWWSIRAVLLAVGISAFAVLILLFQLKPAKPTLFFWLAVIGLLPFCLQTGILDALIWPYYFPFP